MLNNICVVLVGTTHSGNIGSVARAMKTMGLSQLYLAEIKCQLDAQAYAMSAGAKDILDQAQVFADFNSAIAHSQLVIGASARLRHLQNTLLTPKQCAGFVSRYTSQNSKDQIALVFGREHSGLTNQELLRCNYHLCIPANPDYSSLNLAMAVQIMAYELRMQSLVNSAEIEVKPKSENLALENLPSAQELDYFFTQTEKIYRQLGFIQNSHLIDKLRHLYQRANLTQGELNILCGMLKAVSHAITQPITPEVELKKLESKKLK